MTLADAYGALVIVVIVATATMLAELLFYMLVHTSEDYKRACDRVKELNKRLQKEDAKVVAVDKRKSHDKTIERIEDELKEASQRMDAHKLKTNIMSGAGFFFLYRMVAAAWTGQAVARLPFLPARFVQSLSFRGLTGDDKYQCGFGFVYTLCTIGIKSNIPKMLGFTSPKSMFDASRMAAREARKEEKEL